MTDRDDPGERKRLDRNWDELLQELRDDRSRSTSPC